MVFHINSVSDLDSISSKVKWQYFEKLVAFIFSENGFDVRQNTVIVKNGTKRQFDVIATRYGETYVVECKKWKGKSRVSGLKPAVKKHLGRCGFYGKCTPLVVVLADDNIAEINSVPIVPINRLNSFINNLSGSEG